MLLTNSWRRRFMPESTLDRPCEAEVKREPALILIDYRLLLQIKDFLYLEPGWGCRNDKGGRWLRRAEIKLAKERKQELFVALAEAVEHGLELREDERVRANTARALAEAQEMDKANESA
jgi:hypothetical protein